MTNSKNSSRIDQLAADASSRYREQVRETFRSLSDQALSFQSSIIVGGIDREECDRELGRRFDSVERPSGERSEWFA